jgi:hypothetical protein
MYFVQEISKVAIWSKLNLTPGAASLSLVKGGQSRSSTKDAIFLLLQLPYKAHLVMTSLILKLWLSIGAFLRSLPAWLVPRPHQPYDAMYARLPPISTFSEPLSNTPSLSRLKVDFEVWRPSPTWKRKSPGPPDFHICVLDARDRFPSLAQLEDLYNDAAKRHTIGEKGGQVILAVLDNGVSNYLRLSDNLLISQYALS